MNFDAGKIQIGPMEFFSILLRRADTYRGHS